MQPADRSRAAPRCYRHCCDGPTHHGKPLEAAQGGKQTDDSPQHPTPSDMMDALGSG